MKGRRVLFTELERILFDKLWNILSISFSSAEQNSSNISMASTVSIVLARKCAANPLALVLLSEGIKFTSSTKDVTAPRMTSQALDILLCSVLLAMVLSAVVYIGGPKNKKKYVGGVDKNMT